MKEKDRLHAVGNLLTDIKSKKKAKRKAKIKAKVKLKVQKQMNKFTDSLQTIAAKLHALHTEMFEFNPRFTPLQPHTKAKWSDEIKSMADEISSFLNMYKKEE